MNDSTTVQAPSAVDLGHLHLQLHHEIRRLVDDAMAAAGASLSRTKVLTVLACSGPMNQAAIAAELRFAARSITDTVDSLERDGLAERLDDPADRRSRLVRITESGSVALASAIEIKKDLFEQIFASLDTAARRQLHSLLETVYNSLVSEQGDTRVR